MENKQIVLCAMCGRQEEYDMKPGFPRKYCTTCSAIKKAEYDNKSNPVPQVQAQAPQATQAPKQLDDRSRSIVAQCLTKAYCNSTPVDVSMEHVLKAYNYFIANL